MEYTGNCRRIHSAALGEDVDILEYKGKHSVTYCYCSRCGKPILREMYVVQSAETAVEYMYLGSDCIKHFD